MNIKHRKVIILEDIKIYFHEDQKIFNTYHYDICWRKEHFRARP